MSCTRTVWLIDTENIPKKWVKTVYFKTKRDKLIIFLGPEATCMSLKELQVFLTKYPANQVEFCNSNAGKNSIPVMRMRKKFWNEDSSSMVPSI